MTAAFDGVAQARGHVSDAFLALATTEHQADGPGPARARADLGLALGDLNGAEAALVHFPDADDVRHEISALRGEVRGLVDRPPSLPDDLAIARAFHGLSSRMVALSTSIQRIATASQTRMDRYFTGAALTLALLLVLLVGLAVAHARQYRRVAEGHAAAAAEARFRAQLIQAITESTTDAVFMKDRPGRYVYLNAAGEGQLGAPRTVAIGKTVHELLPDDAARRITLADQRVMDGRLTETVEEHVTLHGVERTLLVTKTPALDAFGEVSGIVAISRDITDRKAEEVALRDSQDRLALAMRAARMGAWSVDLTTGVVRRSDEVHAITGLADAFGPMTDFTSRLAEDDRARVMAGIDAAIQAHTRLQETFEFITASGEPRTLTMLGEARYDDGRPLSVAGVVMDVTEHTRMERALHESEAQYRLFLDALPDAVFLNEGDIVTYCNDAFLALRGAQDPAEVIGQPVHEMFPVHERDRVRERIAYVRSTGLALPPEERHVRRLDGRLVPVLASGVHVARYSTGSILVVLRDLRRERQMAAWSSAILDHALDGIVTTSADGVILAANRAAEQMFGHTARELVGRHIDELVPSAAAVDGNQRLETTARRSDGTVFPIDAAISGFELDGDLHMIAVIRDITDRRLLESELRQSHKMEALGQVAGGVAHDFNNLLTVIMGYAEILQDQLPAHDPRRQFANDIRRAGGRAGDLTRQLLAFSRRTVVSPKVLDLNTVVSDMNRMLRRVLGEDVDLVTELHPTDRRIFMDAGSLEQVVMNLAINARDAMPGGGTLTLATRLLASPGGTDVAGAHFEARDDLVLTVTDTGTGIPDAVRARIFEPFFTTKGMGQGTGLGLAVVQSVVHQNGGYIGLESAPGRTVFTIGLPAVVEAETAVEPAPSPSRGRGEVVLVVEDEEPVRRLASITLTRGGYQVLEAENMAAALEIFDRAGGAVDLVVTDVVMPHGGGRALADALAARRPGLPVLFTSGHADDSTLRYGISRHEVPFLAKPYAPAALLDHVRRLLDPPPADPSRS